MMPGCAAFPMHLSSASKPWLSASLPQFFEAKELQPVAPLWIKGSNPLLGRTDIAAFGGARAVKPAAAWYFSLCRCQVLNAKNKSSQNPR